MPFVVVVQSDRCHVFDQAHKDRTVTLESLLRCIQTPAESPVISVTLTAQVIIIIILIQHLFLHQIYLAIVAIHNIIINRFNLHGNI